MNEHYPHSKTRAPGLAVLLVAGVLFAGVVLAAGSQQSDDGAATSAPKAAATSVRLAAATPAAAANSFPQKFSEEGVNVEFSLAGRDPVLEADQAQVRFRITDAASGQPLSGVYPVVWLDLAESWLMQNKGAKLDCRGRVGVYLQGIVGVRPLIDLNSYYVMVMNADPSISVYDPIVGVQGMTNLYAQIILKRRGADWAKSRDDKRMYVSMPVADQIAVIDTEHFVVSGGIVAGDRPTRLLMQADEKYLWVGNNGAAADTSGVSAFDLQAGRLAKFIATGPGHHELVATPDNRLLFATNRDGGTVSVIDVRTLAKLHDVDTGPLPIAIAYSAASDAMYVADGKTGAITVLSARDGKVLDRIETKPGLGPLRFSRDGRWGMAVNPATDEVYVIDPATNAVRRTLKVSGRPYQLMFTDAFAYIRALDSERVTMIQLAGLDKSETPVVVGFPAGSSAPGTMRDLGIADGIVAAPGEAAVMVVNPADNTVYYYMEGMNAPLGAISDPVLRGSGHRTMAVNVVDRTLREVEPGVYAATIKIPTAGNYTVAFMLDSPRILNCFKFTAATNPLIAHKLDPLAVEWLTKVRDIEVGEPMKFRFRLTDPATGAPRPDLEEVQVKVSGSGGRGRWVSPVRTEGDGIFEVDVRAPAPGAYYVWLSAPSLKLGYEELPYFALRAKRKKALPRAIAGQAPVTSHSPAASTKAQ
jgi:YVTN family beta-propeller protein